MLVRVTARHACPHGHGRTCASPAAPRAGAAQRGRGHAQRAGARRAGARALARRRWSCAAWRRCRRTRGAACRSSPSRAPRWAPPRWTAACLPLAARRAATALITTWGLQRALVGCRRGGQRRQGRECVVRGGLMHAWLCVPDLAPPPYVARGAPEWSYADAHCGAYVVEAMVGSQRMLVPDMASRKVEAAIERPAHAPARHGITMAEAVVEGLRTRRRRRARPSTQARSASTRAWSGGRCSRRRCCAAASTAARPRWTVRAPPPSGALQRGAPGLQVLGTDTAGVRPGAKLYR